jgi:hypothetical protein
VLVHSEYRTLKTITRLRECKFYERASDISRLGDQESVNGVYMKSAFLISMLSAVFHRTVQCIEICSVKKFPVSIFHLKLLQVCDFY